MSTARTVNRRLGCSGIALSFRSEMEKKTLNIFEKLNAARLWFQNANVKMSGFNSFANYKYYELSDILPVINKAAKEIGFACIVRFGKEEATLEIVDVAKTEDRIVFTSPMSSASLKGCHEVQNLGAVESYVRRYLYLTAFEIVESDVLDATQGRGASAAQNSTQKTAVSAQKPAGNSAQNPQRSASGKGAEMAKILDSVYPNGERVFSETEKDSFRAMWTKQPADASLEAAKKALQEKLQAFSGGISRE